MRHRRRRRITSRYSTCNVYFYCNETLVCRTAPRVLALMLPDVVSALINYSLIIQNYEAI